MQILKKIIRYHLIPVRIVLPYFMAFLIRRGGLIYEILYLVELYKQKKISLLLSKCSLLKLFTYSTNCIVSLMFQTPKTDLPFFILYPSVEKLKINQYAFIFI